MACLGTSLVSRQCVFSPFHNIYRHIRVERQSRIRPGLKSLAEILPRLEAKKDPELSRPINIGFACTYKNVPLLQKQEQISQLKSDVNLQALARDVKLLIPLDDVRKSWNTSSGPYDIKTIAAHYGIYRDLFDGAYFHPWLYLNVLYDYDDKYVIPVYHGNHVKPSEALKSPTVEYDAKPGTLWTLILTNPDCHFEDPKSEYLHWFVTNIPETNVDKGTVLCDYLPPFPARGTGYHRFTFILFKQHKKLDLSSFQRKIPCTSLRQRTFKTLDFYKANEDFITPAGLAFFQSDWDHSVTSTFHNILDMEELSFEYDYDPERPDIVQRWNPGNLPFDDYLDQHNDPKVIAEAVLQSRLKGLNPFEQEPPLPEHPLIFKMPVVSSWIKKQLRRQLLRSGKYKDL